MRVIYAPFLLAALLTLSLGCSETPPPPQKTTPAASPSERPKPQKIPVNPQSRKLDAEGNLLESADQLYGFRIPMGVEPVEQRPGFAKLHIQTKMQRLVRFYSTRGYSVTRGKAGYTVAHNRTTLKEVPNAAKVEKIQLYLVKGAGRVRELRFVDPYRPSVGPANALQRHEELKKAGKLTDGGLKPAGDGRYYGASKFTDGGKPAARSSEPNVRDMADRVRRWQAEHPDQKFVD